MRLTLHTGQLRLSARRRELIEAYVHRIFRRQQSQLERCDVTIAPIVERNILSKINPPTSRRLPRHIPAEKCRAVIAELAARTERERTARKAA